MQRKLTFLLRSEDEEIKDAGLTIDFDEIARRGAMSKEEKNIAKWYGIYGSRQPGNHMARVVTAGGVMTSAQARNLATLSEKYGQGVLSITTRQAIQFHWLKLGNLAELMRGLADEGSTTMHGCGDVTRNVAACPLAETCEYRRVNVLPHARRAQKFLGDAQDLDNLPRKFKITFSGCGAGCAQPYINCLSFIAVVRKDAEGKNQTGFKVVVGGGLGWDPHIAQELFSFIPEDQSLKVARAVALTYRDHGDRWNRATSRLKVVVERYGIDQVRQWVLEHYASEGGNIAILETEDFTETGKPFPERPLIDAEQHNADGKAIVRIMVPKGEVTYLQFRRIAELTEIYGNQRVYTTNRQNVEIHGVDPHRVPEVQAEVKKLGLGIDGFFGLRDIVPCVGIAYCPKAVSETRTLYDMLLPVVSQDKYKPIEDAGIVNITGCPNSCSPYRIADIGFRGMRIREEQGSVEGYEMTLGGDYRTLSMKLGDFKRDDIPGIVESILDLFMTKRHGSETISQCVRRIGLEEFKKAVYES